MENAMGKRDWAIVIMMLETPGSRSNLHDGRGGRRQR